MEESPIAKVIAAASVVFGRPVAPTDDFFELGGDSINAIELHQRLEDDLAIDLDPSCIFETESFQLLADRIQSSLNGTADEAATGR